MTNPISKIIYTVANNPYNSMGLFALTSLIGEGIHRNATTPFQSKIGNGLKISGIALFGITVVSLIAKRFFGGSGPSSKIKDETQLNNILQNSTNLTKTTSSSSNTFAPVTTNNSDKEDKNVSTNDKHYDLSAKCKTLPGLAKMIKHAKEAFTIAVTRNHEAAWVKQVDEMLTATSQFTFDSCVDANAGHRPIMQDAHFISTLDNGNIMAAVFDGHGYPETGHLVPQFLVDNYQKVFMDELAKNPDDINAVFVNTASMLQAMIVEYKVPDGSTACICYIDKKNGLVYTATLADAEAYLYTMNTESKTEILPLSTIRDITLPKEFNRIVKNGIDFVITMYGKVTEIKDHSYTYIDKKTNNSITAPLSGNIRKLFRVDRENNDFGLLNMSRAFGDSKFPYLSHKPKVSVQPLKEGVLVIACDGLYDYVSQDEIVQIIEDKKIGFKELAKNLAQKSVNNVSDLKIQHPNVKISGDNVTVIAIKISKEEKK